MYERSISNRKVYTKSLYLIEKSINCNLLTFIIHLTFGNCRVNISKCITAVNAIRTSTVTATTAIMMIVNKTKEQKKKLWYQDTDEGLKDRFNHLFIKFTREKQYEHGHELTLLLDEMLDRGLVTPIEYNNLNSLIVIPDKSSDEEVDEEDEMTRVIKDTVDHVMQHDKEELSHLPMELRDEVGKEFLDALLDLELLACKFLIDEFQKGEPLLPWKNGD